MASFNGDARITFTEAHIAFVLADIGGRHASCFTAIIFVKAIEPIVVGAIFTLALEAAIPAIVVGVTGSFPTTEIIEAHIVLALLMVVTDHILAVPATILALATVPSRIITFFSAFGVLVVPLIVVDTFPEVITNGMAAFGSRFGVSVCVLKTLENFVTIFRPTSVIPVILPVTTARIPLRKLIVASSSHKFVRLTGPCSLVLLLVGIFSRVGVSKHFIIDALRKVRTMRRIQIITVVPGIVGDMPGFVLGNATIIITAVRFLVLSELITASAPSGRAILFIAVV